MSDILENFAGAAGIARAARTIAALTAAVVGFLTPAAWAAGGAVGQDGRGEAGLLASIAADVQSGLSLILRQWQQPPRVENGVIVAIVATILALLFMTFVRSWLLDRVNAFLYRLHGHSELAVYGKALAAVVITTACFLIGALLFSGGLNIGLVLLPETEALVNVTFAGCIVAGLGYGLGRALRSSDDKQMRPVPLPPGLGRTIEIYPFAAGAMLGIAAFIDQASRILDASSTSWAIAQGGLVVAQILLIARFLVHAGRARERSAADAGDAGTPIPAIFGATAIAWVVLAVALGALCLGNTRFAMLLSQEVLWAGLILGVAWLLTRFLDALLARLLSSDKSAGRFATGVVGVQQSRLDQAGLLLSAFLNVLIWLFAILLVLTPLQGGGDNVVEQMRPSPMLQSLSTLSLSPGKLLGAIGVLVGGIMVTRLARGWLERRFLPSTSLDVGARTSIVTGLGYVGILVALLATSATLGLQLEKITLLVSALTVGIGFGLQAIIQNFVSGVILLFERPIQIGDWVSVTGSEGRVRRMRVRATEVVADDGSIAIVPNSAFISSTVLNRSGAVDRAAFDLTIKVAGCPSAQAARDLLKERIASCPAIAADPPPRFYLESLGEGVWTFRVRMRSADDRSQSATTSDLLFHLSATPDDEVKITV